MEASMRLRRFHAVVMVSLCLSVLSWLCCVASSAPPSMCSSSTPQSKPPFLIPLLSMCQRLPSYHLTLPLQLDGDSLERALSSKPGNVYTAVLFYASWCPFSLNAHSTFEVLASMYPQIEHLVVEKSSVMPSLFSRYGIHSLPAILVVNQTSRMQFHGSKDVDSLIKFYKKSTGVPYLVLLDVGCEPVQYTAADQFPRLGSGEKSIMRLWIGSRMNEILRREPYFLFSVFFLYLRVVMYLFPRVLFHLRALWVSYRPHLNLEIFGETSQKIGHVLHVIEIERIRTKIRMCKNRNFHKGARNARVWASSLASVSLDETSTSRSLSL